MPARVLGRQLNDRADWSMSPVFVPVAQFHRLTVTVPHCNATGTASTTTPASEVKYQPECSQGLTVTVPVPVPVLQL